MMSSCMICLEMGAQGTETIIRPSPAQAQYDRVGILVKQWRLSHGLDGPFSLT